jgi:hypothetical protein
LNLPNNQITKIQKKKHVFWLRIVLFTEASCWTGDYTDLTTLLKQHILSLNKNNIRIVQKFIDWRQPRNIYICIYICYIYIKKIQKYRKDTSHIQTSYTTSLSQKKLYGRRTEKKNTKTNQMFFDFYKEKKKLTFFFLDFHFLVL